MRYVKYSVVALFALLMTSVGTGQNAIDNNLQVGSGGRNSAQPTYNYNSGNDVVTGNVSGGRQFRGNVGYRATGEFRGNAGSNELFQFRANTTPNQGPAYIPSQPVYRSATGTRGEDVSRARVPADLLLGPAGAQRNAYQLQVDPGAALGRPNAAKHLNSLGIVRTQDGRLLELKASTLTGVRTRTLPTGKTAVSRRGGSDVPVATFSPYNLPAPNDSTLDNRLDAGSPQPQVGPTDGLYSQQQDGLGYSTQVDNRIDRRDNRGGLGAQGKTLDSRVAELEARRTTVPGSFHVAPGEDAYMTLVNRERSRVNLMLGRREPVSPDADPRNQLVRQFDETSGPAVNAMAAPAAQAPQPIGTQQQEVTKESLNSMFNNLDVEGVEDPAISTSTQQPQDGTDALANLDELLNAELAKKTQQAEQQKAEQRARLEARGLTVPDPTDTDQQTQTEETNTVSERVDFNADIVNLVSPKPIDIQDMSFDTVSVQSLSVDNKGRIIEQMQQGERDLAAGKYYEADSHFKLVELTGGGNPYATVGKLHALIGAGSLRAAGITLNTLFTQHPQMVVNRYEKRLLPAPKRLKWVQKKLDAMIENSPDHRPGLLKAYLGYQLDDAEMVEYGLTVAQQRQPSEPLLPLLRRAWSGQ